MSHYKESGRAKSNFYGPFRKPRSTRRTLTRDCTIENPGKANQLTYQRPPHTYAEILKQIISDSPKNLTLSDIYKIMTEQYPYFQYAPMDWKNSIRNCLSTSVLFKNINHFDSKGFRHRYWVLDLNGKNQSPNLDIDGDVTAMRSPSPLLSKKNKRSSSSLNNPLSIVDSVNFNSNSPQNNLHAFHSNLFYNQDENQDILFNFDPNLDTLNNESAHSNYLKIFCSQFIKRNCYPCQLIHDIGKKHFIQCDCTLCSEGYSYSPKKFKLSDGYLHNNGKDANLNIASLTLNNFHNVQIIGNENISNSTLLPIFNSDVFIKNYSHNNNDDNTEKVTDGNTVGDNFSI